MEADGLHIPLIAFPAFVAGKKGHFFNSKWPSMEAVRLLIPLVTFPIFMARKRVLFRVDNTAVRWEWRSSCEKNDKSASDILKAERYPGRFLGTKIFVDHVDRMSNDMASLADKLSRRERSRCPEACRAPEEALNRPTEGFLLKWIRNPCSGTS